MLVHSTGVYKKIFEVIRDEVLKVKVHILLFCKKRQNWNSMHVNFVIYGGQQKYNSKEYSLTAVG